MGAGGDVQPQVEVPVDPFVGVVPAEPVAVGDDVEQPQALAVEQHLDHVGVAQALDVLVPVAGQPHLDLVLAVEGEVVVDDHAAAGAERQPVEVPLLGQVRAQDDDAASRDDGRAADGEPADLLRGREVPLHQSRRQLDHPHVVEAVARVVAGQQGVHVDVEGQEVADGVAVLGAIQAPERLRPPRVRRCVGAGVERGLDVREQPLVGGRLGPRRPRRGHGPGPELADYPLPHLGVAGHVVEGRRLERQSALQRPVVVAAEAVAVDERLLRAARLGAHGSGLCEPQPRQREPRRQGGPALYAHVDPRRVSSSWRTLVRDPASGPRVQVQRRILHAPASRVEPAAECPGSVGRMVGAGGQPSPARRQTVFVECFSMWMVGAGGQPPPAGGASVLAAAERTVQSRVGCNVQRSFPVRLAW